MTGDASYPYLTSEDMRILPDDSLPLLEKPSGQIPVSTSRMVGWCWLGGWVVMVEW